MGQTMIKNELIQKRGKLLEECNLIFEYLKNNKSIFIKNMEYTSRDKRDSWLPWWKATKNVDADTVILCQNPNCPNLIEFDLPGNADGAHVKIVLPDSEEIDSINYNAFIYPLCPKCNHPENKKVFIAESKFLLPLIIKEIEDIYKKIESI